MRKWGTGRRWRAGALLGGMQILLLGTGAALAQMPTPAAPPAPGLARVWVYRVFFPEDTKDMPAVAMNNATIGYAQAGTSFYRDVPAGPYHITVQTVGLDYNQDKDVTLTPGSRLFVKIDSLPDWVEGQRGASHAGTYYVLLVPPAVAAYDMRQTALTNGG